MSDNLTPIIVKPASVKIVGVVNPAGVMNIKVAAVNATLTPIITQPVTIKAKITSDYIHPEKHPASMIVEDDEHQFLTATQKEQVLHGYTHVQQTASNKWYVTHNLGKRPSVTIIDSTNRVVSCDVEHTSLDTLIISSRLKFGGIAHMD